VSPRGISYTNASQSFAASAAKDILYVFLATCASEKLFSANKRARFARALQVAAAFSKKQRAAFLKLKGRASPALCGMV